MNARPAMPPAWEFVQMPDKTVVQPASDYIAPEWWQLRRRLEDWLHTRWMRALLQDYRKLPVVIHRAQNPEALGYDGWQIIYLGSRNYYSHHLRQTREAKSARSMNQLVYDVGAYDGEDTAHYLQRGFRVVSIEADPTLAAKLRERFAAEIRQNRCVVLNVGVAESDGEATFYVCDRIPLLNSFNPEHATKQGGEVRPVRVPTRTFGPILQEHGAPHYIKIDIEGLDHLCVLAIPPDRPPHFVSFEACDASLPLVLHLASLGYTRFRLVDQRSWRNVVSPNPGTTGHAKWAARQVARVWLRRMPALHRVLRSLKDAAPHEGKGYTGSGPMPSDVPDEEWSDLATLLYTWENVRRAGLLQSSWFDIHAQRL